MARVKPKEYEWCGFVIVKEGDHYLVTNPNNYRYKILDDGCPIEPWREDTIEDAKVSINEYWMSENISKICNIEN